MFEQATATSDVRHDRFFAGRGDPRQVWALDTSTGRVVHLAARGVDDDVRRACADETLRCPIAGCPDPRLVAKGGAIRRHHFAHRVAHGDHDAATIFRAEAAAMLAGWARRYRGAHVTTHSEEQLDVVTVESQYSGRSIQLAVTYDRRFDELARFDAPERQLLVGHTRALLLPRAPHPGVPGAWWCGAPRLITELIARAGAAVAVNPQLHLAATLIATPLARRTGLAPRDSADAHPTICFVSDLSTCRLTDAGLATPYLAAVRAWLHEPPEHEPRHPQSRAASQAPSVGPSMHREGTGQPERAPRPSAESPPRRPRTRRPATVVNINRVALITTLADEPVRRVLPDGHAVWQLRAAPGVVKQDGAVATDVSPTPITITMPTPSGRDALAHLTTGSMIAIDGHLESRAGVALFPPDHELEIRAERVEIL